LYPATLLKLFIVSRSFWVEFFGSLRYRIMSSVNRDILTLSLPICILFIFSSHLIDLARNSWPMLNKSGENCYFSRSLRLGHLFEIFLSF
jgi:hypothetical protein